MTFPQDTAERLAVDYSADGFRRRAARRLIPLESPAPVVDPFEAAGDHRLNPGTKPFLYAQGAPKDAAVLIPVVERPAGATVLLTRRTDNLTAHAGQIAFPGGKIDEIDDGPLDAALREAFEEIGLDAHLVTPLGRLSDYLTGSGYRIAPVVGMVRPEMHLIPNPGEVAEVFEVPLAFLMDPANHRRDSREFRGKQRYFYAMPHEGRYIWGVTAGILRLLSDTVYG